MIILQYGQLKQMPCINFAIWTALATKGIGASLQHYNPLVDEMTSNEFNIPKSWKLIARNAIGYIVKLLVKKHLNPVEDRFVIKK